MAHQASVKGGDARPVGTTEGVVGSIAGLGNDIATLAELQAKLAVVDFKESAERAAWPLAVLVAGVVLGLSSIPVVLLGVAELLAPALAISVGLAMVLTGVVGVVIAGVVALVAGMRLSRSFESFRRSREELARNVSWVRTVLVYSGRNVPRRRGT